MRIAIIGAGAIGGFFGAKLAQAGHDVVFIARGRHLQAMQSRGLTIRGDADETHLVPATARETTEGLAPVDAILFCVKLYDSEPAARACRPLLKDDTLVLTLQNGVESPDVLGAMLGRGRMLGGAAYIVVQIEAPGVIRHTGPSERIEFAAADPETGEDAAAFGAVCRQAGVDAHVGDDMRLLLWNKFVLLSASSSMTALTRRTMGWVRDDPVARETMIAAITETVAVARALGVPLADDIRPRTLEALDHVVGADAKASQLVDLERGKRLELEWLSGAIHRFGRQTGVPTPVHSTVYAALRPFASGRSGG